MRDHHSKDPYDDLLPRYVTFYDSHHYGMCFSLAHLTGKEDAEQIGSDFRYTYYEPMLREVHLAMIDLNGHAREAFREKKLEETKRIWKARLSLSCAFYFC